LSNPLFLKQISTLKTTLYILLLSALLFPACKAKKENKPGKEKTSKANNFSAMGLENLNESGKMKDIICQNWDYKEDAEEVRLTKPSAGFEMVYRGYSFFKDGSAIKNPRGSMQAGSWSLNENSKPVRLTFKPNRGESEVFNLAYLMPYEMILVNSRDADNKKIDLSSEAYRYIDLSKDPFYVDNLKWRMKPNQPENSKQVKDRLKGCIQFFILFYDREIKAITETVTFTGLPSCFRWYAGGIYLQKKEELEQKWIDCFYNREQAMQAYRLADDLLAKKYQWPKGEKNWLKQNVYVLRQMEQKLDSL